MITSLSNPRIKNVVQLQEKGKVRLDKRCFVIEGDHLFTEVPKSRLREVYYVEARLKDLPVAAREKLMTLRELKDLYIEEVSPEVMEKMSDTKTPQGILCVVSMEENFSAQNGGTEGGFGTTPRQDAYEEPVLVLENLQDPGNVGTMIRTAEGAGFGTVLLSGGCVDLYSPKCVRATQGSLFRMNIRTGIDPVEAISMLKDNGIRTYAAYLAGSVPYTEPDYTKPTAFVIGNEGNGLTQTTAEACDERIRIPMEGRLESLNAAVAAALCMYECKRKRG